MSYEIKIVGSSLQVKNTETKEIIISQPLRDCWYLESKLQIGLIQLYDSNELLNDNSMFDSIFLSDAVDEFATPFTESTFRVFVYNNLGYSPTILTQTFVSRIEALPGGNIVQNDCY